MIYLISGIDTGVGKTQVTAALGRYLQRQRKSFITAKLTQTGCVGLAEDIREHRRLLPQDLLQADFEGLTCPYVFKTPASPHLAAKIEGRVIDNQIIIQSLKTLEKQYGTVLCEGAGGLLVPLQEGFTILDLAQAQSWPIFLVTCGRLGSLNLTHLSLNVIRHAGVPLAATIFNEFNGSEPAIQDESRRYIKNLSSGSPFGILDQELVFEGQMISI